MSDDFDSRLHEELRALADAVPMSTTIRPVTAAGRYDSDAVSAHRPLSGQSRVRSALPAGLSLAGIALVAVLVVAAAMFGGARNGHSGSSAAPSGVPTPLPTTSPVEPSAWPYSGLTTVQPKVVADFGVDELTSVVRGPGAAAYVLDSTAETVYRVDLQTGTVISVFLAGVQLPAAGGIMRVTGKPRLLATGGGDVLILDESSALWRWHPTVGDTSGRGVLSEVSIEDHVAWGTNLRAIGTFLIDSQIQLYNIYVVSPKERQVIKYPPAADGSGFPSPAYQIRPVRGGATVSLSGTAVLSSDDGRDRGPNRGQLHGRSDGSVLDGLRFDRCDRRVWPDARGHRAGSPLIAALRS